MVVELGDFMYWQGLVMVSECYVDIFGFKIDFFCQNCLNMKLFKSQKFKAFKFKIKN